MRARGGPLRHRTSTFTYILAAPGSKQAVIIDPVDHHCERDLRHLERPGRKLAYVLETHAHADHVTSAGKLRALNGARAAAMRAVGRRLTGGGR